MAQLINLRRRRGVARVSITGLEKKITEAEAMKYKSGIVDRARTLKEKVDTADTEFKKHHFSIVELLDEEYVDVEQGVLDNHEDEVLDLLTRLEWLINAPIQQDKTPLTKATGRRLEHLDKKVTSVNEAVSKLTSNDDVCLIRLYEQLDTFKVELDDIYQSVLNSDEPEDEELSIRQTELIQKLFDCSLVVKRLLDNNSPTPTSTSTREESNYQR